MVEILANLRFDKIRYEDGFIWGVVSQSPEANRSTKVNANNIAFINKGENKLELKLR